tara:strand:- start:91 stop:537 length:447 start_codon:yes stop_codon:yes gene_type:complete
VAEHGPPVVVIEDVGALKDNPGQSVIGRDLKLDAAASSAAAEELNLPNHIRKSRPWRWAQTMGKTGNPFRIDAKNHRVFLMISHGPTTVHGLIRNLAEQESDMCSKMNYLLTVYEVITQCIAAGLLVMDAATGIITLCQGQPKPTQVP